MLIIDASAPDPSRDSGSLRMHAFLQLLREAGWQIDFVADDGAASVHDIERLAQIGVSYRSGNILPWLRREGARIDSVVLSRAPIAAQYRSLIRKFAPQAQLVFDTVDLHFLRERRGAAVAGSKILQRQADATLQQELGLIRDSDLCLVVSEEERRMLAELLPGTRVELLSNIHQVHGRSASFEERRDLLFVGGFSHPPNLDAMQWFIREVLPIVRLQAPKIRLHVVGDITPQASETLRGEGVELHGRVEDLSALMEASRLSVAPLRFGAGVKGKVNLAMSYGLPVVLTPIAAEGMHLLDGRDALIAESPSDFAAAVLRAYSDPVLWRELSDAGLRNIQKYFSVDVARQQVNRIFPA
ncbi:glycosyltransferase [Lysobacter sp.]|uniref:glycosyltransferase n=1 Tax=Lysobacter sp. TaxID=72226 RepID=UPI002D4C5469|nr:glycosyltransferase [Lysobacter sp.]HZX77173.1 glycosyltransferase [Lysobacter sp.]